MRVLAWPGLDALVGRCHRAATDGTGLDQRGATAELKQRPLYCPVDHPGQDSTPKRRSCLGPVKPLGLVNGLQRVDLGNLGRRGVDLGLAGDDGLRLEAVTDAEVGVDVTPAG